MTKPSLLQKFKPYIIEVYPGATLKVLENHKLLSGQSTRIIETAGKVTEKAYSYKSDEVTRRTLVDALISVFHVTADEKQRTRLVATGKKDHSTDAFLAALTGLMFLCFASVESGRTLRSG